jgi:hypothetical protein
MAVVGAITPSTSLPDLARDLARVHADYLEGRPRAHTPRSVVARSWERALRRGMPTDGARREDPLADHQIEQRRRESGLAGVIDELSFLIGSGTDRAHMILVVTDADGVVLWREGPSAVRRRADSFGFMEGATWTEERVGTNAIGTALAESAPVQLFAAEHFELAQHPWYCTATPIHDPVTGRLLGVVDVSGPALTLHPAIGALVEATRRLAEARLLQRHEESLEALRRLANPSLAALPGPGVVVDDNGWVAAARGVQIGRRLAAPAPGRPVHVPGLGPCTAEALPRGWLLIPDKADRVAVELHLDMRSEPILTVTAGTDPWHCPVTPRHAQILIELARAGSSGLSAAELSRAMYGDGDHAVTVRAEVSRLRRTLGSVVESAPYRLAAGTSLIIERAPSD